MAHWQDTIIVQAGGKGSRLGYLTANRPKCLVPIENLPMIFHLFNQFPRSRFIIIGDTHFDVLEKYLVCYARVSYELVRATGRTGTLAGIAEATDKVAPGDPFMIIWSDLVLPPDLLFPTERGNYIGIGDGVLCRWKFENGKITESPSADYGIAGLFLIEDKSVFEPFPPQGQLVKYFSGFEDKFKEWHIHGMREFGLLSAYESLPRPKCRSFNSIEENGGRIIKKPLNDKGRQLAQKEANWYKALQGRDVPTPKVYSHTPLEMDKIAGDTLADAVDLSLAEKETVLRDLLAAIRKLHAIESTAADLDSCNEAYYRKTMDRLRQVKDIIPFADQETVVINGKTCRNPFFSFPPLKDLLAKYAPDSFAVIHGDPTFSNTMRDGEGKIYFIDPRGYFGRREIFGDPAYDYAKVFYSLSGGYDNFNQKRFRLNISVSSVFLFIESSGWENLEDLFFSLLPADIDAKKIRLIHAIIWLSLTTYAWEDYDAICGAFYNGAYLLEKALNEHNL